MIDAHARVPSRLEHDRFVAKPLTAELAALDYASYMSSPGVIRIHSDGRWPTEGFTPEDDLELVTKHQEDHESRTAFTFVLLDPSETEALGCLYLNALGEYLEHAGAESGFVEAVPSASAIVTFWLRQDQQDSALADVVVEAVNDWLLRDWPLDMHLFRVLPEERSSRQALDRLGLRRMGLTFRKETRPYLWYQPLDMPYGPIDT